VQKIDNIIIWIIIKIITDNNTWIYKRPIMRSCFSIFASKTDNDIISAERGDMNAMHELANHYIGETPKKQFKMIKHLFPSDIINIILQYTDNNIIILLQDYFPHSLKYITINEKELKSINKNNYQYIRKLNCFGSENITDEGIQNLVMLTELNCWNCPNITDAEGIGYYEKYTSIFFIISNNGIRHLVRLTELNCDNCPNVTTQHYYIALAI